jgi:hypothetical protein
MTKMAEASKAAGDARQTSQIQALTTDGRMGFAGPGLRN